jgi:integrase
MRLDTINCPQSNGMNGAQMATYKFCRIRDDVVHIDFYMDGKRIRRSTGRPATTANLKYVEKNIHAEIDRIDSSKSVEIEAKNKEISLEEYGYKSLAANAADRRELTNREYLGIFKKRIIPAFGKMGLSSIVQTDVKVWQSRLKAEGLSGKRIHNIRMVFQGIMNDAVADGLISKSPFDRLKAVSQKAQSEIRPFTLDEVQYILMHAEGWFKRFLAVAFFTGMRTGELMALRWEDISLKTNEISIRLSMRNGRLSDPKTVNSIREIEMLGPVIEALNEQFYETGLSGGTIFVNRSKVGFKDAGAIRKNYWYSLLKKLNLPQRDLYNTRHTFATIMISKGEDILWVSSMLGHSDSSVTLKHYAKHIKGEKVKRASFLDGFKIPNQVNQSDFSYVPVDTKKSS